MNLKKSRNSKKLLLDFLIVLFSVFAFYLIFSITSIKKEESKNKLTVKEFKLTPQENDSSIDNINLNADSNTNDKTSNLTLEDYRKKYNNSDITGVLSVKGTKINTLLLQTTNNDFYLRRLPNKKKGDIGSVFIDYRTKLNFDKNTIIYGHNSNVYDIPFRYLREYQKKDFYDKNKYIVIETNDGFLKYEVFSVFIAKDEYRYLNINFPTDDDFLNHVKYLKEKSIHDNSTNFYPSDKIITLQTCLLKDDALIVVCAKQI